MPVADSQGITVTFDGATLGSLVGVSVQQSVAGEFDCTSMLSPVLGSGTNSRVMQQLNPTSVAPAAITVSYIGGPVFGTVDQGRVATLVLTFPTGWSLTGLAYLSEFTPEGAVGEKLRGSATFQLTGFTS